MLCRLEKWMKLWKRLVDPMFPSNAYSNCLLDYNIILFCVFQVEEQGYQVLAKEERQLTIEEAAEFYKQHEGSVSFVSNHFISSLNKTIVAFRNTLNS